MNEQEPLQSSPSSEDQEQPLVIYPLGLMPMVVITPEAARSLREAELSRQNDKNDKPPKPPTRPNARIGRIAAQAGY